MPQEMQREVDEMDAVRQPLATLPHLLSSFCVIDLYVYLLLRTSNTTNCSCVLASKICSYFAVRNVTEVHSGVHPDVPDEEWRLS